MSPKKDPSKGVLAENDNEKVVEAQREAGPEAGSEEARRERLAQIEDELAFLSSGEQSLEDTEATNREVAKIEESLGRPITEEARAEIGKRSGEIQKHEEQNSKRIAELLQEKQVIGYLLENLPESEERIAEVMGPNCRVAVVIPAYGERDYILRPLESLAIQKGVKPDQFEAIVVINNPGKEPVKEGDEEEADLKRKVEHYHRALDENHEILQLIEYINGNGAGIELNPEEQSIVRRIKDSGIKIHAIDKSSKGKTLPEPEANVGGARNRGVAETVARFYEHKHENGIIAQTDADTRVDENYIHNLIKTFNARPELIGLAGSLIFEETGEEDGLFKLATTYSEMEYRYYQLLEFLNKQGKAEKDQPVMAKKVDFSGANMASRAYEAAQVGGVPKLAGGEDPTFGRNLEKIGEIDQVDEISVVTANRLSPRTAVWAGHGQRKFRFMDAIQSGNFDIQSPEQMTFRMEVWKKMDALMESGQASFVKVKELLVLNGEQVLEDKAIEVLARKMRELQDWDKMRNDQELKDMNMPALMNAKMDEIAPPVAIEDATENVLERLKEDRRLAEKFEAIKNIIIEEEVAHAESRARTAKKLISIVFKDKPAELEVKELVDLIKVHQAELADINIEHMQNNPRDRAILTRCAEIFNESQNEDEVFVKLQDNFREELTPPTENPYRYRLIELQAMDRATKEVAQGVEVNK